MKITYKSQNRCGKLRPNCFSEAGHARLSGTVGLCLYPDLLGRDFSCGRAWLMDPHSVQPRKCPQEMWELPLANDITGAEVWHQLSRRLFLGPRLQPNNAFCQCTNVYTLPALLFYMISVQSSLILESWKKWQLFLSQQCLMLPSPTVHCHSFCILHTPCLSAHFPMPSQGFCRLTLFLSAHHRSCSGVFESWRKSSSSQ